MNDALLTVRERVRAVPDFPKSGIMFRDITPLLGDPLAMRHSVDALLEPYRDAQVEVIAGVEARGFLFGALAAAELGLPLVPLRKPGKLPARTASESYDLEYGSATLEAHLDAFETGARVLLVDDVLATGGTAAAGARLIERLGGKVAGCAFVIELNGLGGRDALDGHDVHAVLRYD